MALDEALVGQVQEGAPPVLRLYSWSPHALSLGRFQNAQNDLNLEGLNTAGLLAVRRMTGGGALFHGEDFTYSLVCTQEHLGDLNVKESFRRLTGFLVDTWKSLGWEAGWAVDLFPQAPDLGVRNPVCFAGREDLDILVRSSPEKPFLKLGGNAQRRTRANHREIIFQHGSVPIENQWNLLSTLLKPGLVPQISGSTDLKSLGWGGSRNSVDNLFITHFSQCLGVQLVPWEGDEGLMAEARTLRSRKYGNPGWNLQTGGSTGAAF